MRIRLPASFSFALFITAASSCGASSEGPNVEFEDSDAAGNWDSDASVASDSQPTAASGDSLAQTGNAAGRAAPYAADGGIEGLTLQLTTSPVGGRYQPKNIGAVWIEDEHGKVVKTLQVWAGPRRRYLKTYLTAMAGSAIDVTASATLPRHQTHTLSWDLKDRSGTSVAPGIYRARMELTDSNQTGRSNVVEFDTSQGPSTLTPSDAPSFGAIKLELK